MIFQILKVFPKFFQIFKVHLRVILESVYNIFNNDKNFQVLKMLETFSKITLKCTIRMRLVVILKSIFSISNT